MTAELIAIGSEMLRFGRSDTNGDWLTLVMNEAGIEVVARSIVEDHVEAIATQLRAATDDAGELELVQAVLAELALLAADPWIGRIGLVQQTSERITRRLGLLEVRVVQQKLWPGGDRPDLAGRGAGA